jgi:nucleotide-binding universal stress UspA family protein
MGTHSKGFPMTTAIRKILVPVDFSPHSSHALQVGLDFCRRFDAALGIVHVYEPIVYAGVDGFLLPPSATEQTLPALRQREKQLEMAADEARAAGVRAVETALLQGVTFNEITRYAREGSYDLIVLGTHGRTGFGRVLIGSVAERVVRTAPGAVLAVRLPEQQLTAVGAAREEATRS